MDKNGENEDEEKHSPRAVGFLPPPDPSAPRPSVGIDNAAAELTNELNQDESKPRPSEVEETEDGEDEADEETTTAPALPIDSDDDLDDDDDDEEEEEEEEEEEQQEEEEVEKEKPLPKMSHQTMRSTTAAGFGEIFPTITKPIYSTMDLKKLVSTFGPDGEMPPIHHTTSSGSRLEEFQRIYGKLKVADRTTPPQAPEEGGDAKRLPSFLDPLSQMKKDDHERPTTPDGMMEAMQSNFLKTLVKPCLFRIVLIGKHKEDEDKLIDWTKEVIEDINAHCYSEPITGVKIIYPAHILHVLEGSEDTLMKLMRVFADQFEPTGYDWKLEYVPGQDGVTVRQPILFTTVNLMVIGMFQIPHRVLTGWKAERAAGGHLTMTAEEVPPGEFRERLFFFTRQCVLSAIAIYKLTPLRVPENTSETDINVNVNIKAKRKGNTAEEEAVLRYQEQKRRRAQAMSEVIPKPPFIDYIMRKKETRKIQLRTVREHIEYFWKIPAVVFDQQTEWPISSKRAPYD